MQQPSSAARLINKRMHEKLMELALLSFPLILQLFALINPLSSFPILMQANAKKMNVQKIALAAVLTAYIVALVVVLLGPVLFDVFSITVDSFRLAGGIVLLLLGLETVRPPRNEINNIGHVDSLTSIIATPLLTGPATISFITIKIFEMNRIPLLLNITIAFLIVGIVFYLFSTSIKKVNVKLIDITSRVLGLFIIAVGMQLIIKGFQGVMAGIA